MFKKLIEILTPPSATLMAQREYEEAQRSLLEAQSATEYAAQMVVYHNKRVVRLSAYLKADVWKTCFIK